MKKQRRTPTRPKRLRPAIPASPGPNQPLKHEPPNARPADAQPRNRAPAIAIVCLNAIAAVLRRLTRLATFGKIT